MTAGWLETARRSGRDEPSCAVRVGAGIDIDAEKDVSTRRRLVASVLKLQLSYPFSRTSTWVKTFATIFHLPSW